MKPLLCILIALALAPLVLADEAADRTAIGKLVAALNDRAASHDQLYTADSGDSRQQLERLVRPAPSVLMSELGPAVITLNAVRFITPDVALLDASSAQYGSLYARRVPVLLILRKTQTWQIAFVRVQPLIPLMSPGMNLVDLR